MAGSFESESHRGVLLTLIILAAITAIFVLPFQMHSSAAKGLFQKTESHENGLPNYDIRLDKTAFEALGDVRARANKSASVVADLRDAMVRGEQTLKRSVPTLKVEYNGDLHIP